MRWCLESRHEFTLDQEGWNFDRAVKTTAPTSDTEVLEGFRPDPDILSGRILPVRYPVDFTPDLRRLKSWPSMRNSLWRQPYLIKLTYAENFHLVESSIKGQRLRILDVGCGTGFMSLELSRMGHQVVGIDSNERIIRLARQTMNTDPYRKDRGSLRYEVADINEWADSSGNYDVILFSRVLHDLPHPEQILSKAHGLLRKGGRLVCLEYAFDRLDRRTAIWLYQTRKALEMSGRYPSPHLPEDPRTGVNQILKEPLAGRKEHINTFEEMCEPMGRLFERKRFSWHCYHCWDILSNMRIPNRAREKAVAAHVKGMEQFLIDTGEIQSVLFRFVGTKSSRPHNRTNFLN